MSGSIKALVARGLATLKLRTSNLQSEREKQHFDQSQEPNLGELDSLSSALMQL